MNIVLGVDPGTERSAFVAWDAERREVLDHAILENAKLACDVLAPTAARQDRNSLLAVEWIESYGMPVGREVFLTCLWIGRFIERWEAGGGGRWRLVPRREVKLELCGSARAKDANVRRALLDLVGPAGTRRAPGPCHGIHTHEWAALAVAVVAGNVKSPPKT